MSDYVVWSNEHRCWWGANRSGYCGKLEDAGRYTRSEALAICIGARGGRRFNYNPSEVPILLADAAEFWPDDKAEWAKERHLASVKDDEDYHKADASGYSRADEEWFFDGNGRP